MYFSIQVASMKILVPIDGSYHSDNVIDEIIKEPWPEATECTVLTVAEPLHSKIDPIFGSFGQMALEAQKALDSDIQKILSETTSKLEVKFGKSKVISVFREGKAADNILDLARNIHPDLIILGSHGVSGYNDQSFGSVTLTVASQAPCSVRIVNFIPSFSMEKKEKAHQPMEESRYLVAINGSQTAGAAIDAVLSRPWPAESTFQLISIIQEPKSVFHSRFFKDVKIDETHKKLYAAQKAKAEELIKEQANRIEAKIGKGKVTCHVLEGNVRSLILQIAQDWPADMIIMGAHEHDKNLLEHFLGSVAQAVLNNAGCSVEIVR